MYARLLMSIAVLNVAVVANGDIAAHYSEVWSGALPGSGLLASQWEIVVTVSDPWGWSDDWTSAGLELELAGATFYQDPLNDGNPPNPDWFDGGDSLYTSFYTSPGDWPNAAYDGGIVGIAQDNDTPTMLDTLWFDTIDTGNGDFVLTRFTVIPDDQQNPDWGGVGEFRYTCQSEDGAVFSMDLWIPEPGALALLALGGAAALRRR